MKTDDSSRAMNIALVEDHASPRLLVKSAAANVAAECKMQINVLTYANPESALEAIRRAGSSPTCLDVVVMDFQAPSGQFNGWRAAHEIHALTSAEVIVYTGTPDVARQQEERWPVRDACILAKPTTERVMTDCVRAAILRRLEEEKKPEPAYGTLAFAERMTEHFKAALGYAVPGQP